MASRWAAFAIPSPDSLLITADGGGSNGSRVRLWKIELQRLADELGISIDGSPLAARAPANGTRSSIGCSRSSPRTGAANRWSVISVIVNLIAATTTQTGLKVLCELDHKSYPKGIIVSDQEMASLEYQARRFPRRMELHDCSIKPIARSGCFLTSP